MNLALVQMDKRHYLFLRMAMLESRLDRKDMRAQSKVGLPKVGLSYGIKISLQGGRGEGYNRI